MATTAVEGKAAGGRRGSASAPAACWGALYDAARADLRGLLELRPTDFPYVVTRGTFLIGSWGNYYLIADIQSTGLLDGAGHDHLLGVVTDCPP
jgi:hypothetical protein